MLDKDEQKLQHFVVRKSNHDRDRESEERVELCESSEDLLSWASENSI